jgi:hypothetical protein
VSRRMAISVMEFSAILKDSTIQRSNDPTIQRSNDPRERVEL